MSDIQALTVSEQVVDNNEPVRDTSAKPRAAQGQDERRQAQRWVLGQFLAVTRHEPVYRYEDGELGDVPADLRLDILQQLSEIYANLKPHME